MLFDSWMRPARTHESPFLPILLLVMAGLATVSWGQEVEYDQIHTPAELWGWWSVGLLAPVGQEFVPQKMRLDVVDLYVQNQDNLAPQPAGLFVRIRQDHIAGEVIGTSRKVTVAYPSEGAVRFEFDVPVGTLPGAPYAIELVTDGTGGNPAIAGGPDVDAYPAGHGVVGGTPLASTDMWFRTGARPVAVAPITWGDLKVHYRH